MTRLVEPTRRTAEKRLLTEAEAQFNREVAASRHPLAKLLPVEDLIVLRRDMPSDCSKGGILLPESARNLKSSMATIVAVGPGIMKEDGRRRPLTYKYNNEEVPYARHDRVLIEGWAGLEVRGDGPVEGYEESEYIVVAVGSIKGLFGKEV
jgi:co-chaperonin GroES (HSP10)